MAIPLPHTLRAALIVHQELFMYIYTYIYIYIHMYIFMYMYLASDFTSSHAASNTNRPSVIH